MPVPHQPASRPSPRPAGRVRGVTLRIRRPRRRWLRWILVALGVAAVVTLMIGTYAWIQVGHEIDARLAGEAKPIPRIYGRPFDIYPGRGLSATELVQRLNDVGYAQRPKAEAPGEFSLAPNAVLLITRPADKTPARAVRVDFAPGASPTIRRLIDPATAKPASPVTLEAPLLAAIAPGEKRRKVPLAVIPDQMRQAVLAIEDRRFYEHPGVDPIRIVGALLNNLRGEQAVPGRRLDDHPADHQEHVPDARADAGAQAAGTVHGAGPGLPIHEGSDLRAVPE